MSTFYRIPDSAIRIRHIPNRDATNGLSEQILINLQYIERESQSLSTFADFACIRFVTPIAV